MKLFTKFLPIVLMCIFLPACDDVLNEPAVPEQDGMVLVHIGLYDMSARSVMPNMPSEESIAFFNLYGTSSTDTGAQEVLLGKFNGGLDNAAVLLKPGRWNFTLEARDHNNYPVLKGVRKNIDISVGYSATVHFSLRLINDPSYAGTASITIELPDDIDIDRVETAIDGVILEPPLEITGGIITFYDIMPAGDYLIHFFLKDGEGRALAVITEMLVIRGGLTSEKIITLTEDDFNSPPAAPGNFRITAYTDGNLVFGWERHSWNETGFILNDGTEDYAIDAGRTHYILADSDPIEKKFTFYAVNDFGESPRSEYRAALPETPAGVAAEALSPNSIGVSWQGAGGTETYTVQRADDPDGPYTVMRTIPDTAFIDTGLSFSTVYYYKVSANNMFGSSSVSGVASAETMPLFGGEDNPLLLTENVWTDGTIATEGGTQWFTFIATAGTQFIHADFGTLNDLYVQVYNYTGNAVGSETRLSGNTRSFSLTLTGGQEYYIRVKPYSAGGGGAYRIGYNTSTMPPAIALTESVWADGYIIPAVGEQWFTFTATAETQYIHVTFGALTDLYVHVYDDNGNAAGSETRLNAGTMSVVRSLTAGQRYSIKVRPYSSGGSGAYRIAFNTSFVPPGVTATTLTANTWADGDIAMANGTQWFMFTATAQTQFIHVEWGTLTDLYMQVYENSGNAAGSETRFTGGTISISRSLTAGQRYYIRVRPNSGSGTYRMTFNTSVVPPGVTVTTLTADTWANGNITSAGGTQWFRFTATAAAQYIHVEIGAFAPVYVQVYNNSGGVTGSETALSGATTSMTCTLSNGQQYYIRVRANSGGGAYRITFNTSFAPPGIVTALVANNWVNGNIAANGSQWFRFTATAETQYIHVDFSTLTGVLVRVYDNSGAIVEGYSTNMTGFPTKEQETILSGNTTSLSRSVTVGQQYYVQVWPYSAGGSGTYRITFNASMVPPGAVILTANTWADGYIAGGGSKWFTFTATAATQYIHTASVDTMSRLFSVQVYDSSGNTVGNEEELNMFLSRSVKSGQQYHIQVRGSYSFTTSDITFKIAFNTSPAPPGTIALTANTWADGNIETEVGSQWFRFTATAATQYIHVEFGTLSGCDIQVYDNSGNERFDGSFSIRYKSLSCTLTSGQQYYIRVMPEQIYVDGTYTYSSGTYRIAFNTSVVPPGVTVTTLTANTWANGNLPSPDAEQWFRFTATARTHYIHFDLSGGLSYVYVEGYDSSTNAQAEVQDRLISYRGELSLSCSVTSGRQYLIRVYGASNLPSNFGTYRITFNTSSTPPAITIPQTGVTALTLNTRTDGNIPSLNGTQWFRFTSTAARHSIHVDFTTPVYLNVQVYDDSGILVKGERTNFSGFASINYSLVSGRQYYIRVRMMYSAVGTYKILFNTSVVSPGATVTALAANTWAAVTGTPQWFRFTATAGTQYIHLRFFRAPGNIYVQVYDNSSNAVGSEVILSISSQSRSFTLTAGQQYYIRAWAYSSGGGTCEMAFNASATPPP